MSCDRFFLSHLSTVFITKAMIMTNVDFIFPVSFYLFDDKAIVNWLVLVFGWFLHLSTMTMTNVDKVTMTNVDFIFCVSFCLFHAEAMVHWLLCFFCLFVPTLFCVLSSLSAFSMIAEAMVNCLVWFLASLCTYPILFCVLRLHQRELLFFEITSYLLNLWWHCANMIDNEPRRDFASSKVQIGAVILHR